jgi:hypothetical protein
MPARRNAQIAPEVQEICRRYGIPYNAGSLPEQFGTVVRKIVKLAFPPKDPASSRSAPTSGSPPECSDRLLNGDHHPSS